MRMHFLNVAISVFQSTGAFNDVAIFQTHFVAGEQAEEAFGGCLFEISAFNPHFFTDFEMALASFRVMGMTGWKFSVNFEPLPVGPMLKS